MSGLVLVIDKVQGPSSFDVVRDVRRIFHGEKTGHAGSLDPFATGALVLLLGKATKLSGALLNADKRYFGIAKLGVATDSLDCTGNVTETRDVPPLSEQTITQVLKSFEGIWEQTPPMYSAKKVQGVRLYQLARKNVEIKREVVPVEIFELNLKRWESPYLHFEVHCSKGTYVRALADEIGKKLGTVAHLSELRRLSCGPFQLSEGVTVETLRENTKHYLEGGYQNYVRLLTFEGYGRPNPKGLGNSVNLRGRGLPFREHSANTL